MRFGLGFGLSSVSIAFIALALSCNGADLNVPAQASPDGDDGGATAKDAGKKKDASADASTGER